MKMDESRKCWQNKRASKWKNPSNRTNNEAKK
jgi:hypothetical protein